VLAIGTASLALVVSRRSRASGNSKAAIHSIAVLPLRNLTGNPANDYLSDGLTESLITQLSTVKDLKVVSRGSAFSLKDKDLDPQKAGQMLKVAALLEGSLRQSGDKVRVNVRLVSTTDGEVLWASDTNDALERQTGRDVGYAATNDTAALCNGNRGQYKQRESDKAQNPARQHRTSENRL
jgi:TolB-like protein